MPDELTGFTDGGAAPDPDGRIEAHWFEPGGYGPRDCAVCGMSAVVPAHRTAMGEEDAPAEATAARTRPDGAAPVSPDTETVLGDPDAASNGPGEYRKRQQPVFHAVQWTGLNGPQLREWAHRYFAEVAPEDRKDPAITAEVFTPGEEWLPLRDGDWVVSDRRDRYRPVAAAEFGATFVAVDPDADLTEDGAPL